MNTIVRTTQGWVDEYKTVVETVKVLKHKSGYIHIEDIRIAINTQLLDRKEHLTRKMVVQSVVKLLAKSNKRAIDK